MKNHPTIWESASRPLFVRTVWLEGSELRRGLQRHFLLDYETKRPLERLKSAVNAGQIARKEILKRSISYELNDFNDFDDSFEQDEEDIFLIGSAKLKLQKPLKSGFSKTSSKSTKLRRRSSLLSRKYQSYDSYHNSKNPSRRPSDATDFNSRRSSLQDFTTQNTETADERLAERVLNWLDLAGKEDFLKNLKDLKDMEVKLTKSCKLRQDSIKRFATKSSNNGQTNSHRSKSHKIKNAQRPSQDSCSTHRSLKTGESVKHITIIFNKEGQPIRLNRPAKNIDLCTLSASPSTTRRLAGSLASARLYKSAENARNLNIQRSQYKNSTPKNGNNSLTPHRRLDTVADLTNSNLQKRLQENPLTSGNYGGPHLHDSKKQLHIFMPTLPKKGLTTGSNIGYNTEDGISELSHNFSELCRI